jgi:thiamine biosynthesis protein ThiS
LNLTINGETREVPDAITLDSLVAHLRLAPERLAIERNREVVRRRDWPDTILTEGDRLEIIHFVGGGGFNLFVRTL